MHIDLLAYENLNVSFDGEDVEFETESSGYPGCFTSVYLPADKAQELAHAILEALQNALKERD